MPKSERCLNFEKLPVWNSAGSFKPLLGKLVVIFRDDHKIYVVGKLQDDAKNGFTWRGQSGDFLKFDEKDKWIYISPVVITTKYD